MRKALSFISLVCLLLFASCKFNLTDRPNWEVDMITPLVKSQVTLADAIADSSIIQSNPDNSLILVLQDTVVDFQLADFLSVPDTSVSAAVSLDSIRLSTESFNEVQTLREIGRAAGIEPLLILLDGTTTTTDFDPISAPGDEVIIPASDLFHEAELLTGFMDLRVTNELPVALEVVHLIVRNNGKYGNTDTVLNLVLPRIEAFSVFDTTVDLSGLVVESELVAQIVEATTDTIPSGTPIAIDDQYIEINMVLRDLGASRATAIFPEQDVADKTSSVQYNFGSGIEITQLHIKDGWLKVLARSSINDTLEFTYTLPVARRAGEIVNLTTVLLPAPPGDSVINQDSFNLAGYKIDLTKNGELANVFEQTISGKLLYSGTIQEMDLADVINVEYGLVDIVPSYIEGYLGTQNLSFTESARFEFFDNITGGTLDLNDPKLNFRFVNSIGMDGEARVNSIQGFNQRTGASLDLTSAPLSVPLNIPGPRLPNIGQMVSTEVRLDRSNSNIREFISLLPDSLYFDLEVEANKNGSPALRNNFATSESRISAIMDIELPLHGMTDNLTLETALDLDLTSLNITENVVEGSMILHTENDFPFKADAQVYFYSSSGALVDSLFVLPGDKQTIQPGFVNADGIVESPTKSELSAYFDHYRLNRIRSNASSAIVRFSLTSIPSGEHVKLYSTYGIDFKLVGDFKYQLGD